MLNTLGMINIQTNFPLFKNICIQVTKHAVFFFNHGKKILDWCIYLLINEWIVFMSAFATDAVNAYDGE